MPAAPRRARSRPASLLVLLVALAVPWIGTSPASAHDALGGATPAAGSTLTVAPAEVRLTFAEPPTPDGLALAVTGPDGSSVATGAPSVQANQVVRALAPLTRSGTYTVAYRVVSADGHPVTGSYTFVLALAASPSATSGSAPAANPTPTSAEATPAADVTGPDRTPWVVGLVAVLAAGTVLGVVAARRRRP